MGLLTDPTAGQGKLTQALLKYYSKLCVLLYVAGVASFLCLAYQPLNAETYFSENALLPALVQSEFRDEKSAKTFYAELLDEMKNYKDGIPYPWLLAKFRQFGLDTYTHNFTLNYPLGKTQKFTGKNVYAILRAARASSTESLILSVPYRTPSSMHETTAPSIAVMLAFAKFANKEKYWAKDIIFLITEHEQLGVQAWLEAYHSVQCGRGGILESGDLMGRAGAIQAAINLELHDVQIGHMDMKIEGLNGQLPNLDLFNLVNRMCVKENVDYTFKKRFTRYFRDPVKNYFYSFRTLMAMVSTQATGIPNGNHGLFHRFGIEALTIEGFSDTIKNSGNRQAGLLILGRILEGIFRSLNNLLERFHQSYFFYLLPASDRFISIGLYMPSVCLMAGSLFIKACALWYQLQENPFNSDEENEEETKEPEQESTGNNEPKKVDWKELFQKEIESDTRPDFIGLNYLKVGGLFIVSHVVGVMIMNIPQNLTRLGLRFGYNTETSVFYGLAVISAVLLVVPFLLGFRSCEKSMKVLNVLALLELGTAIISLAMNNFSLSLFCAVILVPLALIIGQTSCRIRLYLQRIFWILTHPFLLLTITVLTYTYITFPEERIEENLHRGLAANRQALVFGIIDSMIYGNWLFSTAASVFLPNWLCFWCVAFSSLKAKEVEVTKEKKKN